MEVSQDQPLGKGQYTNLQRQFRFDDLLWCYALQQFWDRVEESEKRAESFTIIIQGPKESFTDFLKILTSSVNRMISDPDVGQILTESLVLEKYFRMQRGDEDFKGKIGTNR